MININSMNINEIPLPCGSYRRPRLSFTVLESERVLSCAVLDPDVHALRRAQSCLRVSLAGVVCGCRLRVSLRVSCLRVSLRVSLRVLVMFAVNARGVVDSIMESRTAHVNYKTHHGRYHLRYTISRKRAEDLCVPARLKLLMGRG